MDRLYGEQVTNEDPDGLSGKRIWARPHIVHASYLALFDEPYVETHEITLEGFEELAEPV